VTRFVLDCSVTMAWCFLDEKNEYVDTVLDSLREGEALVPSLWFGRCPVEDPTACP
jgi:hypothetical protein